MGRVFPRTRLLYIFVAALALSAAGCGTATASATSTPTPTVTPLPSPTATPTSPCVQLVPGATLASGVQGVPGIMLPAGTYIGTATPGGGGTGQYTVESYTLCFQGAESAIDGGTLTPQATPTSTLGYLVHAGWKANNLFPDPNNFAYLDFCSSGHTCVNSSGSADPFTFLGVDQFSGHSAGYTTFRLQVATIGAPTCLNDPNYYSGTPTYTLYQDGNNASSSKPTYHFLMPPGTRVSTYKGGGTAGSVYVYYCSVGTRASVVGFLQQAMQNDGYTISNASASGFSAATGSNPTYQIDVSVGNPNNYYLRVFVPY